jgi:hypothetical protein
MGLTPNRPESGRWEGPGATGMPIPKLNYDEFHTLDMAGRNRLRDVTAPRHSHPTFLSSAVDRRILEGEHRHGNTPLATHS